MDDILTERSDGILRVELNRPAKKNAMTSSMYNKFADILDDAARDESTRVVLWHGAGDAFTAGNDTKDFLENPPGAGSPQSRLMHAMLDFDKPLVAAVQGVAIGGGTTMLLHCDFVYAAENARFQTPFINLALPPEFGSPELTPDVQKKLIDSVHAEIGSRTIEELEAERDELLLGRLELRANAA